MREEWKLQVIKLKKKEPTHNYSEDLDRGRSIESFRFSTHETNKSIEICLDMAKIVILIFYIEIQMPFLEKASRDKVLHLGAILK